MNTFEKKIKPILKYVGTIGAGFMIAAYIVAVFVLIFGFEAHDVLQITIFALVNAIVGLCITQFLKIQGIDFAKDLPENQTVIKAYYGNKTKDKKIHSIKFFWITSVAKDVFIKALLLAGSTVGVIYIVYQGSGDLSLLGLAAVNLLMFICFGLLSLCNAYDFYNLQHVEYMKNELKKVNVELKNEPKNGIISNEEEVSQNGN